LIRRTKVQISFFLTIKLLLKKTYYETKNHGLKKKPTKLKIMALKIRPDKKWENGVVGMKS
jgi:hypothetical protein